ncbi:MAG: Bug family tripartite tricarboxylate transporter substrate binding protein [Reyranellaceae bacterium]
MLTRRGFAAMGAAAAALPRTGGAQPGWPSKPVRIVLGSAAGSSVDVPVRALCQRLSERFKVSFIVDNKVGAAGTIAASEVARSQPDGYTLLIGTNGELINGYFMWKNAGRPFPYDPVNDFVPVALVQRGAGLLVARPSLGVSTLAEVIKMAKEKPGKLNIGSVGVGSTVHLASELLLREADIQAEIVQFRGSPPTLMALRSDTIDLMFATPFEVADFVERKELVPLAVSHTERLPMFPKVPTFAELGYPKVVNLPFVSFCAPKGTPDAIIRTLNKAIVEDMTGGPGRPPITSPGRESPPLTPEQLAAFIAQERVRWGDIITKAKIQA